MNDVCSSPATKRWRLWLYGLSLLTVAAIGGVTWSLENLELTPGGRLALAIVPVALWGSAILFLILSIRTLDELQVRIQLEALAIAFPAAMMLAMGVEYLQKAGFLPSVTVGDVWPFMFMIYLPALAIARWRYR